MRKLRKLIFYLVVIVISFVVWWLLTTFIKNVIRYFGTNAIPFENFAIIFIIIYYFLMYKTRFPELILYSINPEYVDTHYSIMQLYEKMEALKKTVYFKYFVSRDFQKKLNQIGIANKSDLNFVFLINEKYTNPDNYNRDFETDDILGVLGSYPSVENIKSAKHIQRIFGKLYLAFRDTEFPFRIKFFGSFDSTAKSLLELDPEFVNDVSFVDNKPTFEIDDIKDGLSFESYIADLVSRNDFKNIEISQASGDYGIDVTATKDGIKYAIQCKFYSTPVGISSVQQAYSGKAYYRADIAVVATNNEFTAAAKELAIKTGVRLWDGSILNKMSLNSDNPK